MDYKRRKLLRRAVTIYTKAKMLEQDLATHIGLGFGDKQVWQASANVTDAASELERLLSLKRLR